MSDAAGYGAELAEYLNARSHTLVGSTYILGAGKDVDWLFLVDDLAEAAAFLLRKGWDCESEQYDALQKFMSFRGPGRANALVTADEDFYTGFKRAAEVCRFLHKAGVTHVQSRAHRVRIHAIVRDGVPA